MAPALLSVVRMTTLTHAATTLLLALALATPSLARVNLDNFGNPNNPTIGGTWEPPPIIIPSGFRIAYRSLLPASTLSNVGLAWTENSGQDLSSVVQRAPKVDGPWSTVKVFNGPTSGDMTFTDVSLPPDTDYCYRVVVNGPNGTTQTTSARCVTTPVRDDLPVWRVQLRVRVANVSDAGTDRPMSVWLTAPIHDVPGGNWTGINYSRDDFETGSDFTYDLSQTGITHLHDITKIGIGTIYWDDMLCLRDLQLIVNGQVAYEKVWGNNPQTCKWIANTAPQSVVITKEEIRASAKFAGFVQPTPSFVVTPDELKSRIESLVGTMLFERRDVAWREPGSGDYSTRVSKKDVSTVHVWLPFEGLADDFPNPDLNVSFDVKLSFQPSGDQWNLHLDVENASVSADFDWWAELLGALLDPICAPAVAIAEGRDPFLDCMSHLEDHIAAQIKSGFTVESQRIKVSLPANCVRPDLYVNADGGVTFTCAESARTQPKNVKVPKAEIKAVKTKAPKPPKVKTPKAPVGTATSTATLTMF